jgi:hypothetical protein
MGLGTSLTFYSICVVDLKSIKMVIVEKAFFNIENMGRNFDLFLNFT